MSTCRPTARDSRGRLVSAQYTVTATLRIRAHDERSARDVVEELADNYNIRCASIGLSLDGTRLEDALPVIEVIDVQVNQQHDDTKEPH